MAHTMEGDSLQSQTRRTPRMVLSVKKLIGKRLRIERRRLELTQRRLGDAMGVTNVSVAHYEAGDSCPTADQLNVLHEMGADIQFIVGGIRSTGSKQIRALFQTAFEMIKNYCTLASLGVSERRIIDLSWDVVDAACRNPDEIGTTVGSDVALLIQTALKKISEAEKV